MSPFSVSAVMAMLSSGAKRSTLDQITTGMSFPNSETLQLGYSGIIPALRTNKNFTLEAANSLFVQSGHKLLPKYKNIINKHYDATIQSTDFNQPKSAARMINDWVSKKTRKKIKDLISSDMLDSATKLVLVNAIYFKGDWANKFNPDRTRDADFHISSENKVKVAMMMQTSEFDWAKIENYEMLELPYKGDRISMQILLPNKGVELITVEKKLDPNTLQTNFEKVKGRRQIAITLPKFKIRKTIQLKDILKKLGMSEMFGGSADLSGIDGTTSLTVSQVVQQAFIEVNEEGA